MNSPEGADAFIAGAVLVGTSNAIELMESIGQAQLAASSQLPTDGLTDVVKAIPAIRIVGPSNDDPIFTDVQLPDGWTIKPTDHAMHSDLLDDKGRKRASIFYKAAFYDRSANIYPVRRFSVERDYSPEMREAIAYRVLDNRQEIWRSRTVTQPSEIASSPERWKWKQQVENELRGEAFAFLEPQYPDWESASAYWD